jgi:hypothetical protein
MRIKSTAEESSNTQTERRKASRLERKGSEKRRDREKCELGFYGFPPAQEWVSIATAHLGPGEPQAS